MISIVIENKKQLTTFSYNETGKFPDINGKLIKIEISGKELIKLSSIKNIPIYLIDNSCLIWHGKAAGSVLKILKELYL